MAEAELRHKGDTLDFTPESGVTAGDVLQLKDGRAGYALEDISSGVLGVLGVSGVVRIPKTTGLNFLDGGDVFWDYSANKAHYMPVNDRDFFLGTAVGDWANASTLVEVALNNRGRYLVDIAQDGFRTAIIGTQALSTMGLWRRGGAHNMILSATSEAQKVDALSVPGFVTIANAIVELVFAVPNDGAGTAVDVSMGIASATHATDASSIAQRLFMHLDANSTNISFESADGSTTVAITDSTIDYTEGSAVANLVYVWFDMRNPADVQVYVNGSLVLGATVFDVSAFAGPWFLLAHIEKTSAADVYEFDLHRLRARIGEI
jgi:predicted RecA/RadA family phage recombinase